MPDDIEGRVQRLELPFDAAGVDPYGISRWHLTQAFRALAFLYRRYFSVLTHGAQHIPPRGRAMLVGNHSGGVALDGAMVLASCFLELDPPRLAQGMAEKFINRLPFASIWASRCGQFTGLPEHAQRLLEDDRLLMVFPEGARGTAKLWKDRWSLVHFGSGFVRLALRTKTPIIPFGFIGGGDAIPTISNAYALGRLLGVPYVPITPWLLALPRPVKLEVHYGAPLVFEGDGSEEDGVIEGYVEQVKASIASLIETGRESRRGRLARLARKVAGDAPQRDAQDVVETGGAAVKVLIPGIAGALARKVALRLHAAGHEVIGIDARRWSDAPAGLELHEVDIRKRGAEEVFRKARPQAVIHMATVSHLATASDEERTRINLGGTRAVFDHCRTYGVEHALFIGRHTYYGAGPDAPLYHTEDEPPQELATYPELGDLVAADLYAAMALWRTPSLSTAVLRLCYTLGPSRHGTLASFLRGKRVPMVLGYDPLFQFLHEDDAVSAIVLALTARVRGIYNVCGPQPLPLSVIAREAGRTPFPLPELLLALALGRGGLPRLSRGALSHLKYPIVVDGAAFRGATGFVHRLDELQTVRAFAESAP